MASEALKIETGHSDMIHDAQMDYFSKLLATASSDRLVKIFEVGDQGQMLQATIPGHEGPVWQVAWAPPKFGTMVASCAYDGKVLIHQQTSNGWTTIHQHTFHTSSVNSIAFAPQEFGLVLACASADGKVKSESFEENTFK